MSGLSYFETDRIASDICTWTTLSQSITDLEEAYVFLVANYKSLSPGAKKDKVVERLRNARLAIEFFRVALCAMSGILRVAAGPQHTENWDKYFQMTLAPKDAFGPDDVPSAYEEDNRAHISVVMGIRAVSVMMAAALADGEILSFRSPLAKRKYGPGKFLTAKQHRENLVNNEKHQVSFGEDTERLETARYNIVVHDQLVMKDEMDDIKNAQSRESLSIGLKNVTRAADILIRVARELERPNY
ncbi:hypothetical protein E6O75_ATG02942 [Venturia nashicola]|uniref:Uncharacterized protein n=1 Tax=Venturia nashicola TaxID=86259 RepID=A0A4Z1PDJ1_9PEZI|nr:hypothetical protein E6O75_ATG02942 [Venturia nashicola]